MPAVPKVELPFGPPPVLPDVTKYLEEFLTCPERLPIHNYEKSQQFWHRKPNPLSLLHCDVTPLGTTLKFDRDPSTGKLLGYHEVLIEGAGSTSKNSLSFKRAPCPPDEATRGSVNSFPFWPGGFPEPTLEDLTEDEMNIDFENNLLTVPPTFSNGIEFKADNCTPVCKDEKTETVPEKKPETPPPVVEEKTDMNIVDFMSLLQKEEDFLGLWKDSEKRENKSAEQNVISSLPEVIEESNDSDMEVLSKIITKDELIPVINISGPSVVKKPRTLQWAEEIDVSEPVKDFAKRIPDMAKSWNFELDTFQKQAILKLEEHCNVFVAAHTSAGKTVVAEYAIALSQKNKTRTVYTSPIKALSNQKYRDFKNTFGDVGLITGDLQINQTASCLIMTTEILRSMLYRGSEISRDLEYVIFDEVHYINDSERGHVWEEVLILLPAHVSIVMLSATVPNTLQFANWVGHTKQKKMFVITTPKRPVPLQHFLYTGSGGKTKDEKFLILDGSKDLIQTGYTKALAAKKARETAAKSSYGPKPGVGAGHVPLTQKQEKTMWIGLIDHLKREDKLPVVAFVLSRNRCDSTAENLISVDLTTAEEKHYIHSFFVKCLQRLKEPDREIPQILRLQELLKHGIGIHHSGILPILKEIVEMLFQEGYVKLLFATETFAMGVNMPARTVLFDSIRKFDGKRMRDLLPAEYIQMAGRAGRRGLDKTGTVIIICKVEVPEKENLRSMILGSPTILESKFRLTYSMILNLFRVKRISVEGMMSRSFKELNHITNQVKYKEELKKIEEDLKNLKSGDLPMNFEQLAEFYDTASEYLTLWDRARPAVTKQLVQELQVGRVVVVTHKSHVNKFGIILKVETTRGLLNYKLLVLCDNNSKDTHDPNADIQLSVKEKPSSEEQVLEKPDKWYKMLSFRDDGRFFVPSGLGGHTIITVPLTDITELLDMRIRDLNPDLVMDDWSKRQNPRFKSPDVSRYKSYLLQEQPFERNFLDEKLSRRLSQLDLWRQPPFTYPKPFPRSVFRHIVRCLDIPCYIKRSRTMNSCSDFALQFRRFCRDAPVGQSCMHAVQQLTELTHNIEAGTQPVSFFKLKKEVQTKDITIVKDIKRMNELKPKLYQFKCLSIANFENEFDEVYRVKSLEERCKYLQFLLSDQAMSLYEQYMNRVDVLKELKYIDENNIVQLKGRVACEVGHANELLITELVLHNVLVDLQPAEIAALLSCLVFQQKTDDDVKLNLTGAVEKGKKMIIELAKETEDVENKYAVSQEFSGDIDQRFGLAEVVYEWATGKPFAEIMKLTDVQEGIIVRCIQQLNETMRDVRDAAHIIGCPMLKQKMEDASNAIKRDIVFAASLYT